MIANFLLGEVTKNVIKMFHEQTEACAEGRPSPVQACVLYVPLRDLLRKADMMKVNDLMKTKVYSVLAGHSCSPPKKNFEHHQKFLCLRQLA